MWVRLTHRGFRTIEQNLKDDKTKNVCWRHILFSSNFVCITVTEIQFIMPTVHTIQPPSDRQRWLGGRVSLARFIFDTLKTNIGYIRVFISTSVWQTTILLLMLELFRISKSWTNTTKLILPIPNKSIYCWYRGLIHRDSIKHDRYTSIIRLYRQVSKSNTIMKQNSLWNNIVTKCLSIRIIRIPYVLVLHDLQNNKQLYT